MTTVPKVAKRFCMLKFIITDEADLPADEKLKGLYVKQGDKWILEVEGAVPKKQLDEFREQNITMRKKLEVLGDLDPAEAAKAIKKVEQLEAQLDKDKGKFDELLDKRTKEMKQAHEEQLAKLQTDMERNTSQLKKLKIDQAIIEAGGEYGLRNGAAPDLVSRARTTFDLDDEGNIVARDGKGELVYNKAGEPLQPKDWVESMTKEAQHLFDSSQGAGSQGSRGGSANAGGVNPWKGDSWNLTKQGEIQKQDPDMARRLAAQAGKRI